MTPLPKSRKEARVWRRKPNQTESRRRKNDWVEKFQQGKDQEPYDRARPQGQTYNAINGNYQKIIKQLDAMLPKEEQKPKEENDGFDAFVSGRDEV